MDNDKLKQHEQHIFNINRLALKPKTIIAATVFCLLCALFINFNATTAWADDNNCGCNNNDWKSEPYIVKSYHSFKKAFDEQKRAVIDAYNKQVDKISTEGLKTKDDFHGLRFETDIFENNSNNLKDTISLDSEKAVMSASNKQRTERNAKISKLVDKLNSNVAAKIAKIKAFYDIKISKIYDSLQKGQKVDFDGLKEYNTNSKKVGDFSRKDFDFIGSELINDKESSSERNGILMTLVLVAAFGVIIAVIISTK